jgi:uncharacterized OB-fold protein
MSSTIVNNDAPSVWRDEMPVTNRYTFGIAGERFFRAIKDKGQILGTRCGNCDRVYVPAAAFCERCLGENVDWVDVGTVGDIVAFTELHIGYDGAPLEQPEFIAFVSFGDGGLINRLEATELNQVEIGQKVRAVFKPPGEREGSIQDITHFEIIES